VPDDRPIVVEGLMQARDLAFRLLEQRGRLKRVGDELFVGGATLAGDTTIVDAVKEQTGFGCTLFAGNLRVATTAVAAGATGRAYGTTANEDITRQVLRLGQPFRGITYTIGKDWLIAYDPLRIEGRIVGMVAVFRELLDFAQDLGALRTPEAVLRIGADGTILDANPTACDHAQLGRHDLLGRPAARLLGPAVNRLPPCDVEMELRWTQPDGYRFPVLIQTRFLGAGHLVVVRDHTSETRAQVELRKANAALARAKREAERASEAKSLFLANVSHELRTPLTAILGYAQLLREEVPPEHDDDLARVESSAKYLLNLIDDLLDLTKARAGRMEVEELAVDLAPLLEHVADDARRRVREGVDVVLLGAATRPVRGDPLRLQQVLHNLVSNATKFTYQGSITLRVEELDERTTISVEDTGVGMDATQLDELFEAFSQVHRARRAELGGTGLGLALSRRLARAMGGDLTVTSAPGVGSCFTVTLLPERRARPRTAPC